MTARARRQPAEDLREEAFAYICLTDMKFVRK